MIAVNDPLFSYNQDWSVINYLIPIYSENGANQTLVGREGSSPYRDHRRLKTVLIHLAKIFSLDLRQLRKNCAQLVQRKNKVPLAFHPRLILIPVHTRKPVTKDDGATGYVTLSKITSIVNLEVKESNNNALSRFLFNDGSSLDVQQQNSSLFKIQGEALKIGHAAAQLYAESSIGAGGAAGTIGAVETISIGSAPAYPPNPPAHPLTAEPEPCPGRAEFYRQLNPTILLLQQVLNLLKFQLPAPPELPATLVLPASSAPPKLSTPPESLAPEPSTPLPLLLTSDDPENP